MKQLTLAALITGLALDASAQIAFAPAVNLPVGLLPEEVALGDFDGDGDPDLAVAIAGPVMGIGLWRNHVGSFVFHANLVLGVTLFGTSVCWADVDGDGDLDLMASDAGTFIFVFLNHGNGTFASPIAYEGGYGPRGISAADLDRDGDPDLVAVNHDDQSIEALFNFGGGNFTPRQVFTNGIQGRNVLAADLDRDGLPDLVTANHFTRTLSVLRNRGPGGFAPAVLLPAAGNGQPRWVTAADVDRDGDLDLVAAIDQLVVYPNFGNGTFGAPVSFLTGTQPGQAAAYDLDGDRDLDVVTANEGSSDVSVLVNDGAGGFAAPVSFATGLFCGHVTGADLDDDGDIDLVAANRDARTVSVLMNQTAGPAPRPFLALGGVPAIGNRPPILLTSPTDPAHRYVAALALGSTPGIQLPDGRTLPLNPDPLFVLSLGQLGAIFTDSMGLLDSVGGGQVFLAIPDLTALRGLTIQAAFVVVNPRQPFGIGEISHPLAIRFE